MQSKTIVGSSVKIYINGRILGIGTAVSWNVDHGYRVIYGIDSPIGQEIVSSQVTVTGSLTCTRLRGDGGGEGRGFIASDTAITLEKYSQITLIERSTDTIVFTSNNVIFTDQQWQVASREIVQGTFNFLALSQANESTIGT